MRSALPGEAEFGERAAFVFVEGGGSRLLGGRWWKLELGRVLWSWRLE